MTLYETSTSATRIPHSNSLSHQNLHHRATISDPSRLAPEDAFFAISPPRKQRARSPLGLGASGNGGVVRGMAESMRKREKDRSRSGSRRRKGGWKKLLWIKQPYPDNYTDEETFLDHLQRNPRLQPYEFWPLVADSTVIVQHVCSVTIFVCCFTGIYHQRVSPFAVVSWGSFGTVLGWAMWDFWVEQEEAAKVASAAKAGERDMNEAGDDLSSNSSASTRSQNKGSQPLTLSIPPPSPILRQGHSPNTSAVSASSTISALSNLTTGHPNGAPSFANYSYLPPYGRPASLLSARNQQRLATVKSAILIYCALLGLSPILKSLTRSTTSDSIWAMSCWLMCINVFFFDYGGGVGAKFPASLSTNAAIMASTVLASRLPDTTHVFSLMLFSIEVFGLFPVFRRHLRYSSWAGHLALTVALVMGASGAVGVTVSGGGWRAATVGVVLGGILTSLAMGICSWWLIDLQKYKNEIHGPWDPARPIIRRRWD